MNLYKFILNRSGWKLKINVPPPSKCVIAVAPHTSNWDFILGELAIRSVGMKAGFLMKSTWFFFPLGNLFRAMGGIPVPRKKGADLTAAIVEQYKNADSLALAITPEGTRSATAKWRKGFLYIAQGANVPIVLAYIDNKTKTVAIDRLFTPSGDVEADLLEIKKYYSQFEGIRNEKFETGL